MAPNRRSYSRLLILLLGVIVLVYVRDSILSFASVGSDSDLSNLRVVIYEPWGHDEVVGSIADSLNKMGIKPILNFNFRYSFSEVVYSTSGSDMIIEDPHSKDEDGKTPIQRRLAADSIDFLIITTCYNSLEPLYNDILPSSARVICVQHSGDTNSVDRQIKDKARELARQGRLSVIGLSDHVSEWTRHNLDTYANGQRAVEWARVPVGKFIPVYDYPKNKRQPQSKVFPTRAVIQGKFDPGRRDYYRMFRELVEELRVNPGAWGYQPTAPGQPAVPIDDTAFQLWLIGAKDGKGLTIPPELESVIRTYTDLPYPDYYQLMSEADLLVPAFQHIGYFDATASSSVTAALITRLPILVTPMHLESYKYLRDPAIIMRDLHVSDLQAIRELRQQRPLSRPSSARWEAMFKSIQAENAALWRRLFGDLLHISSMPRVNYTYDDKGNDFY